MTEQKILIGAQVNDFFHRFLCYAYAHHCFDEHTKSCLHINEGQLRVLSESNKTAVS